MKAILSSAKKTPPEAAYKKIAPGERDKRRGM
jgi:hypothetical protein